MLNAEEKPKGADGRWSQLALFSLCKAAASAAMARRRALVGLVDVLVAAWRDKSWMVLFLQGCG